MLLLTSRCHCITDWKLPPTSQPPTICYLILPVFLLLMAIPRLACYSTAIWIINHQACDICDHSTLNNSVLPWLFSPVLYGFLLHCGHFILIKCMSVCIWAWITEHRGSGAVIEGGLTAVKCRGAIDISSHERRFCLLPNRVVPHPADPTLEEGAQHSELQHTDNKLYIVTGG